MHRPHAHADQPILITTAQQSSDAEFEHRRKRYALMMAIRAVCVIVAAVTYQWSIWVSLACIAAAAVLPWCAVILANDGPPKSRSRLIRTSGVSTERALPAGSDEKTVDG